MKDEARMFDPAKIVGGKDAPEPIQWQVFMVGDFICGGTILDEKTVLSAAHCFPPNEKPNPNSYKIRAGSTDRDKGGQLVKVEKFIWNNEPGFVYDDSRINNDYVILKLKSPLKFNNDVKPACLPSADYLDKNSVEERCFVSGWGTLKENGPTSKDLKYVRVPSITNKDCAEAYNRGGVEITDAMLCAGYPNGGKDACQGDSGGPLVCNKDGKAIIAGVVSFGIGCASEKFPGIYARVTHVLSWIKNNMEGASPPTGTTTPPQPTQSTTKPITNKPGKCGSPQYAGDGFCDDDNNNKGCKYDEGDCCPPHNALWDMYCNDCKCKQSQPTPAVTTTPATGGCGMPAFVGDGFCDDNNNNAGCNFDDGDCCEPHENAFWNGYCEKCLCKNESPTPICKDDSSAKYCKKMNAKKCKKSKFYKKCRKTCQKCDDDQPEECKDEKSKKYCKKMEKKGKCSKKKIAKMCAKTCQSCP